MSLSVKAYFKRKDGNTEIHRLAIDQNVATNYSYLCQKLCQVYTTLKPGSFTICWKDDEGDDIVISSDEELVVALGCIKEDGIFKIYINRKFKANAQPSEPEPHTPEPMENETQPQYPPKDNTHPCVICDGCNQAVTGYRYKCLECPDFDLCCKCEAAGTHSHHFILRISSPTDSPGFIPPFLGPFLRNPGGHPFGAGFCKKFMRNMDRAAYAGYRDARRRFNYGFQNQTGPGFGGPYPFTYPQPPNDPQTSPSQDTEPQPTPGTSAGQQAGNPLPFLNPQMFQKIWTTLGGLPTESGGQSSDGTSQPSNNNDTTGNGDTYLKYVGETVAAFLDPLGIDVQVDVEHNGERKRCNQNPTASQGQANQTPSANQGQASQTQTATQDSCGTQTSILTQSQGTVTSILTKSQGTVTADSLNKPMENIHIDSLDVSIISEPSMDKREESPLPEAGDWTYIEDKDQSNSVMDTDDLVILDMPQPEVVVLTPVTTPPASIQVVVPTTVTTSPVSIQTEQTSEQKKEEFVPKTEREIRMAEALSHLIDMGFSNEGGWLTYLLDVKDGDIHQVLDALQPGKYNL